MLQLMREGCSYTYPPLSIARYSFIQLSELEECRVKTLVIKAIIVATIADVQVAGVGVPLGTLTPEAAHSVDTTAILTQARHQLALINV